jgi:hypothetical protein
MFQTLYLWELHLCKRAVLFTRTQLYVTKLISSMGTQPSPYWRLPHVGIIKNPGVISSWRCLYILSRVWVSNWIMICGGFAYEILHNYIPIVRLGRAVRPYKCCFLIAQRLQINKEKAWTMRWRWWPDPYRLRPKSPRGRLCSFADTGHSLIPLLGRTIRPGGGLPDEFHWGDI